MPGGGAVLCWPRHGLLAFVGGGIIMAADVLSDAVAGQMNEVASCFDGETDANGGQGGGTGGDGGNGKGAGRGGGFAVC